MIQQGHLQVFDLILKTKSPLFIGNGKSYTKKEYMYNPRTEMVSFLDEQEFFTYLLEHNLVDAYEEYILHNAGKNLYVFLQTVCKATPADIKRFVRCEVSAADALDDNHTLKEIQRFVRNASGQIYVPGSSIKGALRTALLKAMLLKNPSSSPNPELVSGGKGKSTFEEQYFHTLSLKKMKTNTGKMVAVQKSPLNSILQGLRVSDSLPISDHQICIAGKIDTFTDGTSNKINVCRECICPETVITCSVTLDQSILRENLTAENIRKAISETSRYYRTSIVEHYPQVQNYMNEKTILLGGGVGFQSKTVTDPYYGKDALDKTAKVLSNAFGRHHHEKDVNYGISPRAYKQTEFQNAEYPYGVCEVTIR